MLEEPNDCEQSFRRRTGNPLFTGINIEKEVNPAWVEIRVVIPWKAFLSEREDLLQEMMRTNPVPGFRKDKAPLKIALGHYGSDKVHEVLKERIASLVFNERVKDSIQESEAPLGPLEFEHEQIVEGKPHEFQIKWLIDPRAALRFDQPQDTATNTSEVPKPPVPNGQPISDSPSPLEPGSSPTPNFGPTPPDPFHKPPGFDPFRKGG